VVRRTEMAQPLGAIGPRLPKMAGWDPYWIWAEAQYGQEVPTVLETAETRPEAIEKAANLKKVYPYTYILRIASVWHFS